MKSERGITLTSVMIYVLVFTIVVLTIGRITTYFYKNVKTLSTSTTSYGQYTKFNSYFSEEVNIKGNTVEIQEDDKTKKIIFSETNNVYTWTENKIFRNKVKICSNVKDFNCSYNSETGVITISYKINGEDAPLTTNYIIAK